MNYMMSFSKKTEVETLKMVVYIYINAVENFIGRQRYCNIFHCSAFTKVYFALTPICHGNVPNKPCIGSSSCYW